MPSRDPQSDLTPAGANRAAKHAANGAAHDAAKNGATARTTDRVTGRAGPPPSPERPSASAASSFDRASFRRLGPELRTLLALAIPIILSELGWIAMGIVDTIMVGHLGPGAIGAVGIASASYYAPALFGIGLLLGLDTVVSQAWGAGRFEVCHRWLAQGVYLALAYTPIVMLGIWAVPLLFGRIGINPAVAGDAAVYLRLLNLGTAPLLLYAAFRRYLQGVGRAGPVMFTLITANLINWGGNWALIYGRLGLPALGLRGSAYSTCLARLYMAAVLAGAAWSHERRRGHPLFAHWAAPCIAELRRLLSLGLPAAGQVTLEVGAFGVATLMAGSLPAAQLAAHQIALNCAGASFMVPLGMSAATAVVVGHASGAGDHARARRAGWLALALGAGFMGVAAAVFLVWPRSLLNIYTQDPAVVSVGVHLLAIAAAFQIFDGLQAVATGALRGLGETRKPMLANLAGYWALGLPLGYWLCFHGRFGVGGIWAGLTVALVLIALYLILVWSRLGPPSVSASRMNAAPGK